MNYYLLIFISLAYLAILFAIAYFAEHRLAKGKSFVANPYFYSLSMAVYCTAWTYYGSVGRAADKGIEFITIYLGPTLAAPLWWLILRKIIRICKVQRITTIADFISSRYGKNITLGSIVTLISVLAIIPYISIQIKAIAESFDILLYGIYGNKPSTLNFWEDTGFYLSVLLITFTILFGTQTVEATERHEGMVTAIAFESIVKLVAFLSVGIFVCFFLFDGVGDIFQQALQHEDLQKLFTIQNEQDKSSWFWMMLLSFFAIFCLPRQFQIGVVENVNEKHLNRAMWLFPLYLFAINLFVLPITFAGKLTFLNQNISPDIYVLALPLSKGHQWLSTFIFLGGFSAASSMIIVETIALSTMISNNLVLPVMAGPELTQLFKNKLVRFPLYIRRFAIIIVLLVAYLYDKSIAQRFSLVSIGLISFAGVAQFAPALLGGIFWKRATKSGALWGLLAGFCVWAYTLVLPSFVGAELVSKSLLTDGLWGISALRPFHLFNMEGMDYIPHALFWSMLFNVGLFVGISLITKQSNIEHNQAEIFVDIYQYSAVSESNVVWKETAYMPDIRSLLEAFLGKERSDSALTHFAAIQRIQLNDNYQPDAKLISYAEKILAGAIGTASARIMVASVTKTREIRRDEVVDMVRETQHVIELNKALAQKSSELEEATQQLKIANSRLTQLDVLKDDFLSTVTHELRTPITSIRALSEILYDNPDLEMDERQHFLSSIVKETERITRLISQVLDLEKFEAGKIALSPCEFEVEEAIYEATVLMESQMIDKNIDFDVIIYPEKAKLYADKDKFIQVIQNLVSNALKYTNSYIRIYVEKNTSHFICKVMDDGKGIPDETKQQIFDKFYQIKRRNTQKPNGSGLGLAISKQIIELHQGKIWVKDNQGGGAVFIFELPIPVKENGNPSNKQVT